MHHEHSRFVREFLARRMRCRAQAPSPVPSPFSVVRLLCAADKERAAELEKVLEVVLEKLVELSSKCARARALTHRRCAPPAVTLVWSVRARACALLALASCVVSSPLGDRQGRPVWNRLRRARLELVCKKD
eukprot:1065203-Pleurochrysis_carterae.AAC.2